MSDDPRPVEPSSPRRASAPLPSAPPRVRRRLPPLATIPPLVYGFVVIGLSSCVAVPGPGSVSRASRLEAFPRDGHPLFGAVEIRFDDRQVPFIDAADERDVPYALGLVHAHLRLGQLEFLRKVARAELSEMAGPLARDIDHALRILDIDRAVPEMAARLPPESRLWLDRYVQGVNAVRDRAPLPPEFGFLGFDRAERWTIEDSLAVGRLAGADINWAYWAGELGRAGDPGYAALAERLRGYQGAGTPSFGPETPTPLDPLLRHVKSGSNSFVVAGSRTKSGAAIIASDPHLGLIQPNLWVLGGYRTPERTVVGMMLPGLPVVALGRNDDIAWGGTNMIGLSSTLYDVSALDEGTFAKSEERIRVRWWLDRTIEKRETPVGPLISDAPFFADLGTPPLAIRWRGHEPSDELTAFLRMNRARDWEQFRAAFDGYAVSGQNFLYADRHGRIGQLLAIEADPAAGRAALAGAGRGDPTDPEHAWGKSLGSRDLPAAVDPPEGFLVSCNNVPVRLDPPVTLSGNANDRVDRLKELLGARADWDSASIAPVQTDTFSRASLAAARAIAGALAEEAEVAASPWFRALAAWDGRYDADSEGAFAYQAILPGIVEDAYEPRYGEAGAGYLESFRGLHEFVAEDIAGGEIGRATLLAASGPAREAFGEGRAWGEIHRVRVAHVIGQVPYLGRAFRYGDVATPGSTSTVFKSAHGVSRERHTTTFGSQSRHISDLADPDENWFVLFGGQDGWIGSENQIDQIPLWQRGEFVRIPMRRETVEREFPHRIELLGSPPGAAAPPAAPATPTATPAATPTASPTASGGSG